jgi:hypothetical protein
MMGSTKVRDFAPVSDLSLEELVPKDNFYRRWMKSSTSRSSGSL